MESNIVWRRVLPWKDIRAEIDDFCAKHPAGPLNPDKVYAMVTALECEVWEYDSRQAWENIKRRYGGAGSIAPGMLLSGRHLSSPDASLMPWERVM